MADAFIQVAPDSTGKKMQTFRNTIAGSDVDAEAVVLTDSTGIALGTSGGALNVYLANSVINANINTALLATSAHQTAGDQKTQIVDGLGNVIGSTSNALNVYLASITANAGTNLNTVGLALAAAQTNGGQKTLVVDPINASNAAGVTNGALNVYLPSITANAGTNLNTVGLALAVTQTNGGQKTQIVDPINASNAAGITNGALNVYLPSITVNAGTNLNTALLATSTKQSDGSQKSQIVDGSGNVISATGNALDVNLKTPATVQISAVALPLPTLAATSTKQSDGTQKSQVVDGVGNVIGATANALDVNIKSSTSIGVTGPLTDTQLRASAVPVSGPLTDTQLRASAVPVSGTVATNELPDATATYAPLNSTSTGYENGRLVKATAGVLFSLTVFNSRSSGQFIQIHDSAVIPVNGTIPKMVMFVNSNQQLSLDFGKFGRFFANGIVVCNSSTGQTKTTASSDCWIDAQYK
jgi:hypothetical protein